MARCIRFVPKGHMVEATVRTVHGRMLLRPTRVTTQIVAGVVARAQELYDMEIHAVVAMSNHMHLLLSPRDARQLASFMRHVSSNVARGVGKVVGWREKFWGRRYRGIVVSNEASAQIDRLRYLLAHGAKEGIVLDPADWPGVHAAEALTDGTMSIPGTWFDGTAAYRDRLKGKERSREAYGRAVDVRLSPLPCWRHLSTGEQRRRTLEVLADIRRETVDRHKAAGTAPAGILAARGQDCKAVQGAQKRSPAPAFHAASQEARRALRRSYSLFLVAFREAAAKLRNGVWPVSFPSGCFPPPSPFIPG